MTKTPGATYRIVELKDGTYGVEITRPNAAPSTVTGFATESEADAWADRDRKSALDVNQRAKSIVDRITGGD